MNDVLSRVIMAIHLVVDGEDGGQEIFLSIEQNGGDKPRRSDIGTFEGAGKGKGAFWCTNFDDIRAPKSLFGFMILFR